VTTAKRGAVLAALAVFFITPAATAQAPAGAVDWAYPALVKRGVETPPTTVHRLPGSSRRFSEAEVHDMFHAVDWYDEGGAASPQILGHGRAPAVMACGFCHLPTGQGRPENAALAGLPARYIEEQVAAMRAGLRKGARPTYAPTSLMHGIAANVTPAEIKTAADWFGSRRYVGRTRVVETSLAPKAIPEGAVYRFDRSAPRERLGARILEGPEDFDRFELRDDRVGYIAYAPPGSIGRGAHLATTGDGGRTQPCASCHGAGLKGDIGPPLAGRSPTGLFRQLDSFKIGGRRSPQAAPMRAVVARLATADMIDLAAYVGSLKP
jgi:cytochrome c553